MNNGCNCGSNHSIECTVTQCKYHSVDENYCALDRIKISTHETNPTMCQCTDCESFELR